MSPGRREDQVALQIEQVLLQRRRLVLHGPLGVAEWTFRKKGRIVPKICHFFLFETTVERLDPQLDEGITEAAWLDADETTRRLTFVQARDVLSKAVAMAEALQRTESRQS